MSPRKKCDVLIMGGGPGGATLGALLGRRTKLSVTLVEKERVPREHIGESFIARLTVLLERSGALPSGRLGRLGRPRRLRRLRPLLLRLGRLLGDDGRGQPDAQCRRESDRSSRMRETGRE